MIPAVQVRCLKGQRSSTSQPSYDGIHIVNHYTGGGGVGESYHSSDEDSAKGADPMGGPLRGGGPGRIRLHPNLDDTDSDGEDDGEDDDGETLRLSLPPSVPHKSTAV